MKSQKDSTLRPNIHTDTGFRKKPLTVRYNRNLLRSDPESGDSSRCETPTKLHDLCSRSEVTLQELQDAVFENPDSVKISDVKRCLPLHILADNDELVSCLVGKATATALAQQLKRAHPSGIAKVDSDGLIPFGRLVKDLQVWLYEAHRKAKEAALPTNRCFGAGNEVDVERTCRDLTLRVFLRLQVCLQCLFHR